MKAEPATRQVPSVVGLLDDATARIASALGLERREARLEAQVLAARALGINRAWLLAHDRDVPSPAQAAAVEALVARRERGEPVAYILGEREFFGLNFVVTPAVLIPRPETELLVQLALERLPTDQTSSVLDLGTGSGAIALAVAAHRPLARVLAVDRSSAALEIACSNANRLGLKNVEFLLSNWYSAPSVKSVDIILSNPPYIAPGDPHLHQGDLRFEPREALQSADGGLEDIRTIIMGALERLQPGGWLLFEHGYDQYEFSRSMLRQAGCSAPLSWCDLSGLPRVSGAQRN